MAVLGLVALLRLMAWDSLEPLIVLDALTLIVYLPAWVVAIGALILRRWWLAAAAAVIIVAQVAFVAATDMTWPNGAVVPPFARIDHVLTGARLAVTAIAAKPGFGSDHRYLAATSQSRPDIVWTAA